MRSNKTTAVLNSVISLFLYATLLSGQQADNENGTYTNPVIWHDFPDNDVIRVGDTYYMVTTTMHVYRV